MRAVLPRALYRVELDGGHEVTAHAPTGPGRNFVRLIEGDRVEVAIVARDAGRAQDCPESADVTGHRRRRKVARL